MELLPIWIVGLVVNALLFQALVQIKYPSPLFLPSLTLPHQPSISSGIKRLILFIPDGLRAQDFFHNPHSRPRMDALMHSGLSVHGITVGRAPTMSKACFMSMFAGIYDDTTAELRSLWTWTPDLFDTVFNRSSFTLLLGAHPLPLKELGQGAGREHIYSATYVAPTGETSGDPRLADHWVRDELRRALDSKRVPGGDKVIMLLHFLATDVFGHSRKTKEILATVSFIDRIVAEMELRFEDYFGDNQTMFIVTSDHGMAYLDSHHPNVGKHGGDTKTEIETPFLIWAGDEIIERPREEVRLAKVDMAPLIAAALNIPFPLNSVGHFPAHLWRHKPFAYNALLANWRQVHQLLSSRRALLGRDDGWLPFQSFPEENDIAPLVESAAGAAWRRDYPKAIALLDGAINLTLEGVEYYKRYEESGSGWLAILSIYSFLVWTAVLLFAILHSEREVRLERWSVTSILVQALISIILVKGLFGWSVSRCGFLFIPIHLSHLLYSVLRSDQTPIVPWLELKSLIGLCLMSLLGAGIVVMGLYDRRVLSLGLLLIGLWEMKGKELRRWNKVVWIGSLALLAIFLTLPVAGMTRNPIFQTLGPLACGCLSVWCLRQFGMDGVRGRDRGFLWLQTGLVFSVSFLVHFPLSLPTRILAWTSLGLFAASPFFISASCVSHRLLSVFLGLATPISFLSFTYDSLFFPAISLALLTLLKMEGLEEAEERSRARDCLAPRERLTQDFRRTWLLILFSLLSFFGTESMEHMAELEYSKMAQCFVYPLSLKQRIAWAVGRMVAPLFFVAVFFRLIIGCGREAERSVLILLLLSQPIAFYAFFTLKNQESPQQIGISLAHYIIPQSMAFGLALLRWAARPLLGIRA